MNCLICKLNSSKDFPVFESDSWLVDLPADIILRGLYFLKTKRHVEHLAQLSTTEANEMGHLIQKYSKISQKEAKAKRIIAMSLGFSEPHVHFWIIPVTGKTEKDLLEIKKVVKKFTDNYRKTFIQRKLRA